MKSPSKPSSEELLQRIDELQKQVEFLMKERGDQGQGPRFPLWILVRDYLRQHGGSAESQEIVDSLLERGHKMGRYPLRNLKITVTSPHLRTIFRTTKEANGREIISLTEKPTPGHYAPRSWRGSKPPKSAKES